MQESTKSQLGQAIELAESISHMADLLKNIIAELNITVDPDVEAAIFEESSSPLTCPECSQAVEPPADWDGKCPLCGEEMGF